MVMTMITADMAASPWTTAGLRRGILAALPFIVSNGIAGVAMGRSCWQGAETGELEQLLKDKGVTLANAA